ncbi:MAG TPA: histidine kinase [Marmoricola sp.]|nr:histidine kinase [Marmoricola sp.]
MRSPFGSRRLGRSHHLMSAHDRAAFRTLHTASLMSAALRGGLNEDAAERSIRHLRSLLAGHAVALTNEDIVLAWDGERPAHGATTEALIPEAIADGGTSIFDHRQFDCGDPNCPLRKAILAPLVVDERIVGTLQVFADSASASLVRATTEVAEWVSVQLRVAELDASHARLMEAEVRALRAQISPHFIYNALNAIASFVRTDPDRARALLVEFADFTRYSFRRHGEYVTLEEELRSIERYLVLEQARFGERLQVTLRIAPEVLPITVPVFSLQPLVENAVRHGLGQKAGDGRVTIVAEDRAGLAVISIEDDGVGEDPKRIERALAGDPTMDSVGLGNVDARLRSAFGEDYGLVVETAPGAGTKVTVRVPKFAAGVNR